MLVRAGMLRLFGGISTLHDAPGEAELVPTLQHPRHVRQVVILAAIRNVGEVDDEVASLGGNGLGVVILYI